MQPRNRAPRRRVVGERRVCQRFGGAVVTTIVCDLDCGHVVEGTAGWGRRACRQCGEEGKNG